MGFLVRVTGFLGAFLAFFLLTTYAKSDPNEILGTWYLLAPEGPQEITFDADRHGTIRTRGHYNFSADRHCKFNYVLHNEFISYSENVDETSLKQCGLTIFVINHILYYTDGILVVQVQNANSTLVWTRMRQDAAKLDLKNNCKMPEHPLNLPRGGPETGFVVLAFLVDPDGHVKESKIVSSEVSALYQELTRSALNLCIFKPATVNGKSVAWDTWVNFVYIWKLDQ